MRWCSVWRRTLNPERSGYYLISRCLGARSSAYSRGFIYERSILLSAFLPGFGFDHCLIRKHRLCGPGLLVLPGMKSSSGLFTQKSGVVGRILRGRLIQPTRSMPSAAAAFSASAESRFPAGMTERKARAEADPYGMTIPGEEWHPKGKQKKVDHAHPTCCARKEADR